MRKGTRMSRWRLCQRESRTVTTEPGYPCQLVRLALALALIFAPCGSPLEAATPAGTWVINRAEVQWEIVTADGARETRSAYATAVFEVSAPPGFPDVPPDHWAYNEIMACAAANVVRGYPDGLYHPALQG